jgi:hypothetical protein
VLRDLSPRRVNDRLRKELTTGERVFFWCWYGLLFTLPTAIFAAAFLGGAHGGVVIAGLVVVLLLYAIPIEPFLKARIRRRERARDV